MTEDLNALAGAATSEQGTQAATEFLKWLLDLGLKLFNDAVALVTSNYLWIIVILVLMKALDLLISHFKAPFPSGMIRWVLLFFVSMFFSGIWIPIFSGLIGG